jgi:hypothetical protein
MFLTAFQANAFQNNAFQVYVAPTPTNNLGGGDDAAWTPEDIKRFKKMQLDAAKQQKLLNEKVKDANAARKQAFKELIDPSPVAKVKKTKVQSKQEVKADIPLAKTQDLERSIRYLETQKNNLLRAEAYRQNAARLKNYLDYLEAQQVAELDDEVTVLALL